MNWTQDRVKLKVIFDDCISLDARDENKVNRTELCENFISILSNQNRDLKERLIKATWLFDNGIKSRSRERFFEICLDEDLLSPSLLTDLYVSVHTQARPFAWFNKDKMDFIFESIETPFTCIDAKDKIQDLGERMKIYRGIRQEPADLNECGFSWTLKREIAEKFASGDGKLFGYIISGYINRENILGYVLFREEFEIVAKSSQVIEKKIEKMSSA